MVHVRQLSQESPLVGRSGWLCKVYCFPGKHLGICRLKTPAVYPEALPQDLLSCILYLMRDLFTWFSIFNLSALQLKYCHCSLHYNCSLKFVTEYIFFQHLLLIALCFMSTFHGFLCKNIGFLLSSAGIPMTSLTSCLHFPSFVFTDQIYLTETNTEKKSVRTNNALKAASKTDFFFLLLSRKRIIINLGCSFRSSSWIDLEGSWNT